MKSRLALTLAAMAAVVLAVGFSGSDAAPVTDSGSRANVPLLKVAFNNVVSVLDVGREFSGNGPFAVALGVEGLMKIAPDGSLQPNLAESVTTPTRSTYIYQLRKGIKFWDGNELTAEDAANALNYYRFPKMATSAYYASVKNIKATDRYTVAVTLKHPDASWQYVPAFVGPIFEKAFADAHPGTMGRPGVLTMGTGPWKFDSLDPTSGIELSANQKYWGGKPQIDHISIKFIPDQTNQALAFRAGEIDLAPQVLNSDAFAATSGAKVSTVPSCAAGFFSMNTQVPPWNDVHVRRAAAYAINRADIVAATGAPATPLKTLIPPSQLRAISSTSAVNNVLKTVPTYPFDLTKAKQELARSAYPQGFSTNLTTTPFGALPNIAQTIAGNLQKIGINVKVNNVPIGEWLAEFSGPRDKIGIFFTSPSCLTPDPSLYPGQFVSSKQARTGGINIADYKKPAVDELIKEGVITTNGSKRLAAYGELLKVLGQDVPYDPLYVKNANYALSPKFKWPEFDGRMFARAWALEIKPTT